jgi:hypothetical protein
MRLVFTTVKETILQNALRESGIMRKPNSLFFFGKIRWLKFARGLGGLTWLGDRRMILLRTPEHFVSHEPGLIGLYVYSATSPLSLSARPHQQTYLSGILSMPQGEIQATTARRT